MFHGSDELVYHYPTILRFAKQLPGPDLTHYGASQTPLYHLLMAYVGKVVGYRLWRLRAVEVLISYGLAWAVFGLLHRRVGLERRTALILTTVFALSPYVFAPSFRLMTDNLALLFTVGAIDQLERFRGTGVMSSFLVAAGCIGAAMLTRQSSAFLLGVALLYLLLDVYRHRRWRRASIGVAALLLACAPVVWLFVSWHGLIPLGGLISSCGLCSMGGSRSSLGTGLTYHTAELALATLGFYGSVLFAPLLLHEIRRGEPRRPWIRTAAVASTAVGAGLLLVFPANLAGQPGGLAPTAGLIWRIAATVPSVAGSSLVFWLLVPIAGAVLAWRIGVASSRWRVGAYLVPFLLSTFVIRLAWQKYVDPFVLLALLMTVRRGEFLERRNLSGVVVVWAVSLVYLLSFV
jgi:4-amino-4-deoxy-L-arabinose transferase-like glycosyltransferase